MSTPMLSQDYLPCPPDNLHKSDVASSRLGGTVTVVTGWSSLLHLRISQLHSMLTQFQGAHTVSDLTWPEALLRLEVMLLFWT